MIHNMALNRELCSGSALAILAICALAAGLAACSFDSSALSQLDDDVIVIESDGGYTQFDADFDTDVRDASTDIAADTGSDAEVHDASDIDTTVVPDSQDGEILSDATPDSDELGDDVEVGMDAEVGDTMDAEVLDAGSDALTDTVIEDVTTDVPAEILGDTELDSDVTSSDASADTSGCERDRDCGFGQICWMGECLDNQTCNPFAVKAPAGVWLTWYPSAGPSVSERASGSSVWDESPPGACAVAVTTIECQCLTHFGVSSCGPLPAGGSGCAHNDDHIP